jgi:hypothetical protein
MRKVPVLLLTFLAMLSVMTVADIRDARAAVCTDGQSMEGRNACTCRPPMKFLPGNVCGFPSRAGTPIQVVPNANPKANQCALGQNARVSGCRCEGMDPELKQARIIMPDGKCAIQRANAVCAEGQSAKLGCTCMPPMKLSRNKTCVRLAAGETRPLAKRVCGPGADIVSDSCACNPPFKSVRINGRFICR